MSKRRVVRSSKYSDEFKRRLVAESHAAGVSVPMVAKKHGVPDSRIYAWRGDVLFQPSAPEDAVLMPVEVGTINTDVTPSVPEPQRRSIETSPSQVMEITLENGRKLSVSDGL